MLIIIRIVFLREISLNSSYHRKSWNIHIVYLIFSICIFRFTFLAEGENGKFSKKYHISRYVKPLLLISVWIFAINHTFLFQSERFNANLATINWYKLPLAEQRIYQFLLVHAQQSCIIRIADVKPLNMETFVNVSDRYASRTNVLRMLYKHELYTSMRNYYYSFDISGL